MENELAIYYAIALFAVTKVIVHVLEDQVFGQAFVRTRFCVKGMPGHCQRNCTVTENICCLKAMFFLNSV